MTLVHENDAAWFLTLDETHHEMTTAGKEGSASSGRWVNGSFPRSGERNVVGNFHTTGVYGTTLAGEALPIEHIVRNKLINMPGGLFRTGLIVANCRVVMESSKQAHFQRNGATII